MCYIILPRPELIYYVQHRLYAPIGAIGDTEYFLHFNYTTQCTALGSGFLQVHGMYTYNNFIKKYIFQNPNFQKYFSKRYILIILF